MATPLQCGSYGNDPLCPLPHGNRRYADGRAAVRQTPIPHGASGQRLRFHIATMRTIYSVRDALMRKSASLLAVLVSIISVHTSLRAQRMDSAMVGAWAGRAQIAVSWSRRREVLLAVH